MVELFTSEGCSSCPPADDVLRTLDEEQARATRPIYALEFHVDYWNELGWVDPFSAAWATQRQQDYAHAFRQRGVYTPQIVINGRDAFVGSDLARARRSVNAALSHTPSEHLSLHVARSTGFAIAVDFDLSPPPPAGVVLNVGLVEARAVSIVHSGENAGRTLRHTNIVRSFQSIPIVGRRDGHVTLQPAAPVAGASEVVAYVQELPSMTIQAAARAQVER